MTLRKETRTLKPDVEGKIRHEDKMNDVRNRPGGQGGGREREMNGEGEGVREMMQEEREGGKGGRNGERERG